VGKACLSYTFQDSLRVVLENTRNIEAGTVGTAFASVWASLGPDQQQTIKTQIKSMKRKRVQAASAFCELPPVLLSMRSTLKKTDPASPEQLPYGCNQVIARENFIKAMIFHSGPRFFEYHALHYESFFGSLF